MRAASSFSGLTNTKEDDDVRLTVELGGMLLQPPGGDGGGVVGKVREVKREVNNNTETKQSR